MTDGPKDYTRAEEAALRRVAVDGGVPLCPRCGDPLQRRRIRPREEVAYVRRRSWWLCGACQRGLVIDERKLPGRG
jgi:transposase-like protein